MGCKVKATRSGRLAFRIFWPGLPTGRSWETTDLTDTPENRKLVSAQAVLIEREIKNGSFRYLKWFPYGNKAQLFGAREKPKSITIGSYYEKWIEEKKPPLVRKSQERDYRQHFNAYILPRFKEKPIDQLTVADLGAFRVYLIQKRGLSVKTARNAISGSLQAFLRDAKSERVIEKSPFDDLPPRWWPAIERPEPDPFTEDERDRILAYYQRKGLYAYRYLYFQFWTGWRPSEATALKWSRVDLKRGVALVRRSRSLGTEAPPKTRKSRRAVELLPNVVRVLRDAKPLHVTDEAYVFLNTEGRPMRIDNIRIKTWYNALRALEIRPRKPSATRHTFISTMLSHGMNPKRIAELVGNSQETIEQHYGKYIRYDDNRAISRAVKAEKGATAGATARVSVAKRTVSSAKYSGNRWWSQRDSNPCYRRERPVS